MRAFRHSRRPRDRIAAVEASHDRPKVILIAGLGRSGSTLLGHLLGQIDGFFFVGEAVSLARALKQEEQCGCRETVAACPTWQAILDGAFPDTEIQARSQLLELDWREMSGRAAVTHRLRRWRLLPRRPDLEARIRSRAMLLRALVEATGSRVVVDSSKWPGYASLLEECADIDLYVVHLVREPLAVANSRRQRTQRTGWVDRWTPAHCAMVWSLWNPLIELLWRRKRYLRVTYAEVVRDIASTLRTITTFVGEEAAPIPFLDGDIAQLEPTHSVAGNRSRFVTGAVPIRPDEQWRSRSVLTRRERLSVQVLTLPARLRYSG